MKLHELKSLSESRQRRPSSGEGEFVYEGFDGFGPEGFIVHPFDVLVEYYAEEASHSDHPYGDTTAREDHPAHLEVISLTANEDVLYFDEKDEKELKRFPKGTKLQDLPGWDKGWEYIFHDKALKEIE
jgi:hypothetical protein